MKAAATMPAGPYHFDPAKGATLFADNCAACHQASGMG
jgi:nitrite reductase (NO-forming)